MAWRLREATVMRSLLLAVTAALVALGAGWYVVEWMPSEARAAASIGHSRAARPQEIRSVRLTGDRLPLTILESRLATKVGDSLDADRLDADRIALRDVLVARGFWATDVSPAEIAFGSDGGAHVTFRVTTGLVFHVRGVAIEGEDRGVLAEALTLTAGDDVSPQRLARNAELLATHLARAGRPAQVSVETTTDREAYAVDVTFVVKRAARR
jgi:outer membrane protein assembly factor BamA